MEKAGDNDQEKKLGAEAERIRANETSPRPWHRWGPYVSERQWGTVREDYSADGNAWNYFPHEHARSRAYRWSEDGLAGWSDRHGLLCLGLALWNGKDPILKERLFGLTNSEGNHGEDVKECYWYIDGTPTHSYMKMLYKYPQQEFPYEELVRRNREAGKYNPEFELLDTGVFDENRYFDVTVEYAKDMPNRTLCKISIFNHGPETAAIWVLPTIWFRNTWSWKHSVLRPGLAGFGRESIKIEHPRYGALRVNFEGEPELLFTENETNSEKLFGTPNAAPYVKDAFHRYVIEGESTAVNPSLEGTKAAAVYKLELKPGEGTCVRFALVDQEAGMPLNFDALVDLRKKEADEYYAELSDGTEPSAAEVQRQAVAGLLWSKQFYHYDVATWLAGDPTQPCPPSGRHRNENWKTVYAGEVLSMPDTWEYPWFAAWDMAFHAVALALVDANYAKEQLLILLREWYMHPNGQIPAYEWSFNDANPPVHAWAAWRIYTIERRAKGKGDIDFLERIFHKLLLNFTWWVNREDAEGNNVFEGGFLGLDNIGLYDRNQPFPDGSVAEQSDGTSWMAMFCLNMLDIALELAEHDSVYEDVASKFFEHFMYISAAMNTRGTRGQSLWSEEDGFYYDLLNHSNGVCQQLKVRSAVGLIPLFAVTTLEPSVLSRFPDFRRRMQWFLDSRPDLTKNVASMEVPGEGRRLLLSIVGRDRLTLILQRMLDPNEFLSEYGLRSVSRVYANAPYSIDVSGMQYSVDYEPGESLTGSFGGNSNWRGPIWFPINYLLIESLQKFDFYFGSSLTVPLPANDGPSMTLANVAAELERRLMALFLPDGSGRRPCNGGIALYDHDAAWKDLISFSEYFHGDTGKGLGASHQTGWTAIIAKIIQQLYVTAPHTRYGE